MIKKTISLFALLLTFLTFSGSQAQAQTALVNQPDLIKGPLFRAGETITLKGQVDGDVFLAGGEIFVDAVINGDLIVTGGKIDIQAQVRDDLRIVGGQIKLNTQVGDDVTVAGGQIEITPDSTTTNTLVVAGGYIDTAGVTTQTTQLFGSRVIFSGQSGDDTTIFAEDIDVYDTAQVNGNLKLIFGNDPKVSQNAVISGDLLTEKTDKFDEKPSSFDFQVNKKSFFKKLTTFVVVEEFTRFFFDLLIGALLIYLLPKFFKDLFSTTNKQTGQAIGWGILTFFLAPIIGLTLMITLIGIPLGVFAFIVLGISVYLSRFIASLFIGSRLFNDSSLKKPYQTLALGLIIFKLVSLIPVFGWLAHLIFLSLGLGALTILGKQALNKQKK
ncbi:hypothetical protein ACFL18_01065 [Patescibacteria group bacterium]